ncbi:hypothetical protein FH972_021401 [Carpinus fangiana]|uniref:Uncharacterized protein n=1 Tax=Carpinus fangiana TaxID=176857 RepID=A0A5N6KRE8_9ROSI|nr:hypothetical protein FH972_021401 [Carpinus fangiana]
MAYPSSPTDRYYHGNFPIEDTPVTGNMYLKSSTMELADLKELWETAILSYSNRTVILAHNRQSLWQSAQMLMSVSTREPELNAAREAVDYSNEASELLSVMPGRMELARDDVARASRENAESITGVCRRLHRQFGIILNIENELRVRALKLQRILAPYRLLDRTGRSQEIREHFRRQQN